MDLPKPAVAVTSKTDDVPSSRNARLEIQTLRAEVERLNAALGAVMGGMIRYVGYDCADCGAQIIEGNSLCKKTGNPHTPPKNGLGAKTPDETISPLDFHPRWRAAVQGYMGEGELWEIVCEMGEEIMRLRGVTHRSEKATATPPFAIGTRVRFIDAAADHVEWVVYRLHDGWVYLHASDDRTYTHCAKPEKLRAVEGSGCCGDVTHGGSPNGTAPLRGYEVIY